MKSPSSKSRINRKDTKSTKKGRRVLRRGSRPSSRPSGLGGSKASEDRQWMFDPESAIERKTHAIVPLWVAESIVAEASRWLGAELPKELPAWLAAKAEKCFAGHRQFHRKLCSEADGGNAAMATLRMFLRHWTAAWLKRNRLSLFRRLPWEYALGKGGRVVTSKQRGEFQRPMRDG